MNMEILKATVLFENMEDREIESSFLRLNAQERDYKRGDSIFFAGKITQSMGLVLDGSVTIESNDIWGNRTLIDYIGKGGFFAETYALLEKEPMLVNVTANEDCRVLFLRVGNLKNIDQKTNPWKDQMLTNLLNISVNRNLDLTYRTFHTSPKTIRGRLVSYLNAQSLKKGSMEFEIPFDRQQLADYLNVDRSALSKELGKMKKEGIIDFRKNHFKIEDIEDEFM